MVLKAVSSLTRSMKSASKSKRDTNGDDHSAARHMDDNFLLNIAFYMYHRAASIAIFKRDQGGNSIDIIGMSPQPVPNHVRSLFMP